MSKDNKLYHQIEDYLNGKLNGAELATFEKALASDTELRKTVEASKIADELVIENRIMNAKNILVQHHAASGKKTIFRNKALLGTGIVLISAGLWWGISQYDQQEEQDIVDEKVTNRDIAEKKSENDAIIKQPEQVKQNTENDNIQGQTEDSKAEKSNTSPENTTNLVKENDNKNVTATEPKDTLDTKKHKEKEEKDSSSTATTLFPNKELKTKDSSVQKNTTNKVVDIHPCDTAILRPSVKTRDACRGENNGEVTLDKTTGGKSPYHSILLDDHEQEVSFEKLSAGNYVVKIEDINGCTATEKIHIDQKYCKEEYSFNPSFGEQLELPAFDQGGKMIVYDTNGSVFKEIQLYPNEPLTWDGKSQNGQVKPGYYAFTIKFNDGSQKTGNITIVQ